jgi:hypothetical protein
MTVSFAGKPPIAVAPLPTPKPKITSEGAKSAFLGVLGRAATYEAAAKKIKEATFRVVENTLEIHTNLSATMIHMLFEGEVHTLLDGVLAERGAGNIKIKFLPALRNEATSTEPPQSDTLSAPFKRLVDSAAKLNKVSDQLTIQIEQIDAALKNLNLGVTAWVMIAENEDEDGNWIEEELGYTRIGSRWGVALRTHSGTRGTDPNHPDETFSAFADAPRPLRIRAVPHIPKLIDQLSVEAEAMIAKLSPEVDEVSALALALQASGVKK